MNKILYILLGILAMNGCSEKISNYKIVQQVAMNCFYDYKDEGRGIFEGKEKYEAIDLAITNCFFLNKEIICISSWTKVFFYNIKEDKFFKILSFTDEWKNKVKKDHRGWAVPVSSYNTMATKKDEKTIFIFNFGTIYEYDLENDKLTKIYEGFDKLFNFEKKEYPFSNNSQCWGKSAPIYFKINNSFFFTVQYGDWQSKEIIVRIKEFSLNDFSVKDIIKGWRPYVVEYKNALYYISEDHTKIIEMDLNTYQEKRVILQYDLPIYYFVPNKTGDRIVFIHRTKNKDIKGSYSHESKIWYEKENKIRRFSDRYWAIASDIIFPEDM